MTLTVEPIAVGCVAPALDVIDPAGTTITIQPRATVLVFYRGRWCDHCRAQLDELARFAPAFRTLGSALMAVSADPPYLAGVVQSESDGRILVLSDQDASVIRSYGVPDRDDSVPHVIARPSAFVIDAAGVVRYRYIGRSAEDRPRPALLLLAVESLSIAGDETSTGVLNQRSNE